MESRLLRFSSVSKNTKHAGQPISCFKCQRFNHKARFCPDEQSCENCGRPGHVSAQCKNNPRCINCRGPHPATSMLCPLRACEIEKRKVRMEARLIHQLKANNPEAKTVQVITELLQGQPNQQPMQVRLDHTRGRRHQIFRR